MYMNTSYSLLEALRELDKKPVKESCSEAIREDAGAEESHYAVTVDFGSQELAEYDEDDFSSLEEAKNYCKKLLDVDEIAFEENTDGDKVYYVGNKGQVFFTIYKD